VRRALVPLCVVTAYLAASAATVEQAGSPKGGPPQTRAGLEMTMRGVERAPEAGLNDCPPGTNTVKGLTKPGEEFAIVTVGFKLTPAYKPGPLKRPTLLDAAGNTYYTGASFVDATGTPEFTCAFPFRIPAGAALKSVDVNGAVFDLSAAR
jgi:hypothetical protein